VRSLAAAISVALAEPPLWLLGSVGFLARGGFLVLALPIWWLPSPAGLATLFGPDAFTPTGLSGRFLATLAGLLAVGIFGIGGLVVLAAWSDRQSIERQLGSPETPMSLDPAVRSRPGVRLARLIVVHLAASAPIVAALLLTARSLLELVRVELLQPGDLAVPLVVRVAAAGWPLLAIVAVGVGLSEILGSLAIREAVAGRDAVSAVTTALGRMAVSPISLATTLLLAWTTSLVALAPSALALAATANLARTAYLDPEGPFRAEAIATTVLATIFLASAFCAAVLLAGFASAVRSHLWTLAWWQGSIRVPSAGPFGGLRWAWGLWTRRRH
jgi:hypothetical protein